MGSTYHFHTTSSHNAVLVDKIAGKVIGCQVHVIEKAIRPLSQTGSHLIDDISRNNFFEDHERKIIKMFTS